MPVAGYLMHGFQPHRVKKIVAHAVKVLRLLKFDAIAIRGVSGLVIGPIVAYRLNKDLIVVRKSTEPSHSMVKVETQRAAGKYVVIDDFVGTGNTVKTIVQQIHTLYPGLTPLGGFYWKQTTKEFIEDKTGIPFLGGVEPT